ncbi:MAG: hypothetical protein K2I25_04965, partial [Muribaculaceae bacterium]|nr:hypothetical protein [Muribaculaceae bacterium]
MITDTPKSETSQRRHSLAIRNRKTVYKDKKTFSQKCVKNIHHIPLNQHYYQFYQKTPSPAPT